MKVRASVIGLSAVFLLGAVQAGAWEERPVTLTEGRVAAAFLGNGDPLRGLVRITVGERTVGVPPNVVVEPVREACVEVIDFDRRLIDQCARRATSSSTTSSPTEKARTPSHRS